jgi:hypothetical protein
VAEKFPTKTKPATAKNALAALFLALRVLMQVGEMVQNKNNLAQIFWYYHFVAISIFKTKCATP